MFRSIVLALTLASASAFVAPKSTSIPKTVAFETKADLEALAKELNPVVGFFDPLNLAEYEFWDQDNAATIGFLRHAEIKHGRVAMAAFVGYCVHANGIQFPWAPVGGGVTVSGSNPPEIWDAVPLAAQVQIILFIGFLEVWSERSGMKDPHYMRGGKPGKFPSFKDNADMLPHSVPLDLFDPFGLSKNKSEEKKAAGLLKEINNGRLAQLGLFGFFCESKIPGSVPLLSGIVKPYAGEYMGANWHMVSPTPIWEMTGPGF